MSKKLFVGSLPYSVTDEALKTHFAQAGNVESAILIKDRETGRSKGFGFVEFSTEEEAKKAITMFDGKDFEGRSLVVNEAKPQREKPRNDYNS